jgi:hypothetical protein
MAVAPGARELLCLRVQTVECRRLWLNIELEILKVRNAPFMLSWIPRDLAHERPEWVEKHDSELNVEH